MNRRAFLRASALTAAGLYVAPELLAEPRRRIFPVGIDLKAARTVPTDVPIQLVLTGTDIHGNRIEHVLPVVDLGNGHYRASLNDNIEFAGRMTMSTRLATQGDNLWVGAAPRHPWVAIAGPAYQ